MTRADSGAHRAAVVQALLVTVLWSSSWVLIRIGLQRLPPLSFAGLRYALAAACLLPFSLRSGGVSRLRRLNAAAWGRLIALGLLLYAITQGAIFVGLASLPAMTVSLLLNFTSPLVALLGLALLSERPGWLQWAGLALFVVGVVAYFGPVAFPSEQALALAVVAVGVLANAASAVLGRNVNRRGDLPPLLVTSVSMAAGGLALLVAGLTLRGLPRLELREVLLIVWLAVVNTAAAFTLWNHTLRRLAAVESSVLNGTMLIQIAILAWLFLGESLDAGQVAGMAAAALGAFLVQLPPPARAT